MKKILISSAMVLLLAAGCSAQPAEEVVQVDNNQIVDTQTASENKPCLDSAKYFVVSPDWGVEGQTSIIVKTKTDPSQQIKCEYKLDAGDFQIKDEATYLLDIDQDFLVLDQGTGPGPRGLLIYNLKTKKKVFTDSYSQPIEYPQDTLTYWSPNKTKPTSANCPQLAENTANGLGAVMESQVSLDLQTLTKKDLGPTRCTTTQ